jgi:hypothetical protein
VQLVDKTLGGKSEMSSDLVGCNGDINDDLAFFRLLVTPRLWLLEVCALEELLDKAGPLELHLGVEKLLIALDCYETRCHTSPILISKYWKILTVMQSY